MKNRDGVRQIEKGSYEINFRPFPGAKRVFKRIKANSVQEARMERVKLMASSISLGNLSELEQKRRNVGLEVLLDAILNDLHSDNKNKKTINRFLSCWKKFMQFISEKHPDVNGINTLKAPHFKDYQDYIVLEQKRPMGWPTEFSILKAALNRLRVRGYCSPDVVNELKQIKIPKKRNKKKYEDISDDKIMKLLSYIKKDRPDLYGITVVIYKCGWRITETTLIKKQDIKWNGLRPLSITIWAENTKTGTKRVFDRFDDELASVVRQYAFAPNKTEWLFPNRNNNNHSVRHYEAYLAQTSLKVINHRITPHYFRHRLCTIAGRNNMPIPDIQAITGIRDIKVLLEHYQHDTPEGKDNILALSRLK